MAGGGAERHTHIKEGRKGRKGAERERERESKRERERKREGGRQAGMGGGLFCKI